MRPSRLGSRLRDLASRHPHWLALTALLVLIVTRFTQFFPRFGSRLIGAHGDTLLLHLHLGWQWTAISEGRLSEILSLPTMHPSGSGLSFGEPLFGIALLFAPVHWFTGSTVAAFNAALVGSFVLVALACFLLVRELIHSDEAAVLAAAAIAFVEWRLRFITAINLLTVYFVIFALWLLVRWVRKPSWAPLVGAALLLHLQLVTAAQAGIVGCYLALSCLLAVWSAQRFRVNRLRVLQLAVTVAVVAILGLPWLAFFAEAAEAAPDILRTGAMQYYQAGFWELCRRMSVTTPLGAAAALGAAGIFLAHRLRLPLPPCTAALVAGMLVCTVILFVTALGPIRTAADGPAGSVGFLLARTLPLLGSFRAPARIAAMTPIVLTVCAAGAYALTLAWLRRRFARLQHRGLALAAAGLPLLLVLTYPDLPPGVSSPISARPRDLALAEALSELPADAVVASLPLRLGHRFGSAVDERVLVHRRRQVAGFASVIPHGFWFAERRTGNWPRYGNEALRALGATHVVVPEHWLADDAEQIAALGYEVRRRAGRRAILASPPGGDLAPVQPAAIEAPAIAAAGRWITVARDAHAAPSFRLAPHGETRAHWHRLAGSHEVTHADAFVFYAGIAGIDQPDRFNVPVPDRPGHYRLEIDAEPTPIVTEIQVSARPTSADEPIRAGSVELSPGAGPVTRVRAGTGFLLAVKAKAGKGPIWLATSTAEIPERRGEAVVTYAFRQGAHALHGKALPWREHHALRSDLAPGETAQLSWVFRAPNRVGVYDLWVRVEAHGLSGNTMPWHELITGLEVTRP